VYFAAVTFESIKF